MAHFVSILLSTPTHVSFVLFRFAIEGDMIYIHGHLRIWCVKYFRTHVVVNRQSISNVMDGKGGCRHHRNNSDKYLHYKKYITHISTFQRQYKQQRLNLETVLLVSWPNSLYDDWNQSGGNNVNNATVYSVNRRWSYTVYRNTEVIIKDILFSMTNSLIIYKYWWRHQMETFSALLAICVGNSLVNGEFPAQRSVTLSFDALFDLRLNRRLSKESWDWWFEMPSPIMTSL